MDDINVQMPIVKYDCYMQMIQAISEETLPIEEILINSLSNQEVCKLEIDVLEIGYNGK
jgi:hypothetical protein